MPDFRLLALGGALIGASALFLFQGLSEPIGFILELRLLRLAALFLVGAAIGVSTVVFQTVSENRILTPSLIGFDSLFILLQTSLVASLGAFGFATMPTMSAFLLESAVMIAAATLLFGTLLARAGADIQRILLVGIIMGLLFRSLSHFLQRLLDPSEYAMVQSASFMTFSGIEADQLAIAGLLCLAALTALGAIARELDVMALGRDLAIPLGVRVDRMRLLALALVAALVSVSTALVGPVSFFGLLVASLAHAAMRTHRHQMLLPAAGLIGAGTLVAGQLVFERVLHLQSTLSAIIEIVGGIFFIVLVLKGRAR